MILGERFGAWRVFESYRGDLGLEGGGDPSNDSAGIWENGAPQQVEGPGVCGPFPSLTPGVGWEPHRDLKGHPRNSTGSREAVHSVREFRHTMPPRPQQEKPLSVA